MIQQEYFDSMDAEQKDINARYESMTREDTRLRLGWL